jgi:hypothetical protein
MNPSADLFEAAYQPAILLPAQMDKTICAQADVTPESTDVNKAQLGSTLPDLYDKEIGIELVTEQKRI